MPIIGVGLFLLYFVGFVLTHIIMARKSLPLNFAYRWLSPRYHFWNAFISQCLFPLFLGTIVLSNVSFYARSLGLAVLAALLVVLQYLLSRYAFNGHSVGLHCFPSKPGIIRVRGIHPDYLARLPAYNESEATTHD